MHIKTLATSIALALGLAGQGAFANESVAMGAQDGEVKVQLIRNATVKITYADTTFLIDPMLAKKELAGSLGDAMGVVFEAPEHETLYLVGDTIWRNEVDQALAEYHPQVVVANAGYARLNDYDGAIIMGKEDVVRLVEQAPEATVVAVHMDAINHMGQTRDELSGYVREHELEQRVEIPKDGETLIF